MYIIFLDYVLFINLVYEAGSCYVFSVASVHLRNIEKRKVTQPSNPKRYDVNIGFKSHTDNKNKTIETIIQLYLLMPVIIDPLFKRMY